MKNVGFNNIHNSPKLYRGPNLQYKYYTKKELEELYKTVNSPEFSNVEKEQKYRKWYCDFIQTCGKHLKLPVWVIASAIVLCQRFYVVRSFKKNERVIVSAACILLACKIEDCNRSIRDIINICYQKRYSDTNKDLVRKLTQKDFMQKVRELVANAERAVLYANNFVFETHAYPFILDNLKILTNDKELLQVSVNFYNDSFKTNACLQVQPRVTAVASIALATQLLNKKVYTHGLTLWDKFCVEEIEMRDIQMQILDLYENKNNQQWPAIQQQVKHRHDTLKSQQSLTQTDASVITSNGVKRPKYSNQDGINQKPKIEQVLN